jgi:hypothetical protein
MENQSPILSVKPIFIFWQEVASQLLLLLPLSLFGSTLLFRINHPVEPLLILLGLVIGFFLYLQQKKEWSDRVQYDFYDDYFTLTQNKFFSKAKVTVKVQYTELSKLWISNNYFEKPLELATISIKRGEIPWYYYLSYTYNCEKVLLYPYFFRPYLSMIFYYGLDPNQLKLLDISNIPNAKEVYALLTEKTSQ